jgi:spore coat polysaccharide biosynthesis protein SpsF
MTRVDVDQFYIEEIPLKAKRSFFPCMIVVQARMLSTRLPGKVLKEVLGKPLLLHLVERLRRVTLIDGIVIATSVDPADDVISAFCDREGLHVVRGSQENVLSRIYAASKAFGLEALVRITADCPLIDPMLIDKGLSAFHAGSYDYLSNTLDRTFARGMDFEIIRFSSLEKAFFEATSAYDKEHVTPFIYKQPERFRLANVLQHKNEAHLRLTVDEESDFVLTKKILEALYPKNPEFVMADIRELLQQNPALEQINAHVAQKS